MATDPPNKNAVNTSEVGKIPNENISDLHVDQTENNIFAEQKLRTERIRNDQLEQDLTERKQYAKKIYWLIVCWLFILGFIILLQGFLPEDIFFLSDSVLLALIGGTTANVLGMFFIVLKYLFPQNKT